MGLSSVQYVIVCVYVCVCVRACVYMCVHACVCACVCVCVHVHVYEYEFYMYSLKKQKPCTKIYCLVLKSPCKFLWEGHDTYMYMYMSLGGKQITG